MLKLLALLAISSLGTTLAAKRRSTRRFRSSGASKVRGQMLKRLRGGSSLQVVGPTEQIEPWEDHGKAVQTHMSDENLMELSSHINAEVYGKELHDFVDEPFSRFVALKGNSDSAEYIKKQFEDMGLKVTEQPFKDRRIKEQYLNLMTTGEEKGDVELMKDQHKNVIGYLKGGDLAHETVLLGAHYDSVNWDSTSDKSPGVDDNGSGTALMLAVARALTGAGKKFQPRRSVMFVAFNAEEEGLVGSEHFVPMLLEDAGQTFGNLRGALICDEVAWPGRGGKDFRKAIFETKHSEHQPQAQQEDVLSLVDTLAKYATLKNSTNAVAGDGIGDGVQNFVVNYHGFGSDHIPFLDAGMPAVLLIERDDDYHSDTWGHSAKDTFDHVDLDYGAAMTRLAMRTIAAIATPKDS